MEGYLLETTFLSAILDPRDPRNADAVALLNGLDAEAPKFVPVIALAELSFGCKLFEAFEGATPPDLLRIAAEAANRPRLDVTYETAEEYGQLRANLAKKYLTKAFRRDRPRWIENWQDKATGQALQIDENDLWMCALARERDMVLVTADRRMSRISDADIQVRLLIL